MRPISKGVYNFYLILILIGILFYHRFIRVGIINQYDTKPLTLDVICIGILFSLMVILTYRRARDCNWSPFTVFLLLVPVLNVLYVFSLSFQNTKFNLIDHEGTGDERFDQQSTNKTAWVRKRNPKTVRKGIISRISISKLSNRRIAYIALGLGISSIIVIAYSAFSLNHCEKILIHSLDISRSDYLRVQDADPKLNEQEIKNLYALSRIENQIQLESARVSIECYEVCIEVMD